MKIIAMVGDSHTWGQGVGAEYYFQPPVVCADLRMVPFDYPNYVNLIRDVYSISGNSSAKEYYADGLTCLCEEKDGQFGIIKKEPLLLKEKFAFCRVFLRARRQNADVSFSVDGSTVKNVQISSEYSGTDKCIKVFNLFAEDIEHELSITASNNSEVHIHRIEFYSGEYAVVNCGVGSCTVERYISDYFDNYVAQIQPYAVVFEGCTINDWISGKSPDDYSEDLKNMISHIKNLTSRIIIHTPFPVAGPQILGNSAFSYTEYIEALRKTAKELDIPLADTYNEIKNRLDSVPKENRNALIYHDKWHANGTGNYIYAKTILPVMQKYFID